MEGKCVKCVITLCFDTCIVLLYQHVNIIENFSFSLSSTFFDIPVPATAAGIPWSPPGYFLSFIGVRLFFQLLYQRMTSKKATGSLPSWIFSDPNHLLFTNFIFQSLPFYYFTLVFCLLSSIFLPNSVWLSAETGLLVFFPLAFSVFWDFPGTAVNFKTNFCFCIYILLSWVWTYFMLVFWDGFEIGLWWSSFRRYFQSISSFQGRFSFPFCDLV